MAGALSAATPPPVGGGSPRCVGEFCLCQLAGVRSHVGPGWGFLSVFTMLDLQEYWCAILGLNQLRSVSVRPNDLTPLAADLHFAQQQPHSEAMVVARQGRHLEPADVAMTVSPATLGASRSVCWARASDEYQLQLQGRPHHR